jgi:hypothetical protein
VNKNFVYYSRLVFSQDGTDVPFCSEIRVNIDYDLYNSWRKAPNGDYYLNNTNAKLIEKTLKRLARQTLENKGFEINFDMVNSGIVRDVCDCGAKHILITNLITTSNVFPSEQCLVLNLQFTDDEDC